MCLCQCLAKTLVFTQFWKGQKHYIVTIFYDVFVSRAQQKKRQTIAQKRSIDFQKHLIILAFFFPATDRQKRENTTRLNDFGGWRAGAPPQVAKAGCRLHRWISDILHTEKKHIVEWCGDLVVPLQICMNS